jgi:polysaccharide export outer membrane protein
MFASRFYSFLLSSLVLAASGVDQKAANSPAAERPEYRIGPGDVLQVEVWKEPEASTSSATVRIDGVVSLALLGEVQAAGRTTAELRDALTEKYGSLIRGARVIVLVKEVTSQRVYVIGEVRREGPIRLVAPLTVLQALAEAGGTTDYAKRKRIYLLRISDNRRIVIPFDYDAVVRGQKMQQNVVLLPGDTIVVPR